jgi:hypothetical protein
MNSVPPRSSAKLGLMAAVSIVFGVGAGPAGAAAFVFDSGQFGGQRGMAMQFAEMLDDGEYSHWNEPASAPAQQTQVIELYDPLVGQAVLTGKRSASASASGNQLSVSNAASVRVQAGSAGTSWHDLYVGRPGIGDALATEGYLGDAHFDSTNERVAFRIEPGAGEQIGDPVTLTFDGSFSASHKINDRGYSQQHVMTGGSGDDEWTISVDGRLSGPYPAPYTVSVRSPESVRDRPVARAPGRDPVRPSSR